MDGLAVSQQDELRKRTRREAVTTSAAQQLAKISSATLSLQQMQERLVLNGSSELLQNAARAIECRLNILQNVWDETEKQRGIDAMKGYLKRGWFDKTARRAP